MLACWLRTDMGAAFQVETACSAWLTAAEAALYLKVQTRTVLSWVRQGKLKGYALSGSRRHVWRFRVVDLDDMMKLPSVAPANRRMR